MRVPAQLPEKPSYQRWTRLQPMLEIPAKSWYSRVLAPANLKADRAHSLTPHMEASKKTSGRPQKKPVVGLKKNQKGFKKNQW